MYITAFPHCHFWRFTARAPPCPTQVLGDERNVTGDRAKDTFSTRAATTGVFFGARGSLRAGLIVLGPTTRALATRVEQIQQ